jgi:hypothetical protein
MLHHDNAPAHTSLLVREVLAKHRTAEVIQLLYSPELDPVGYFERSPISGDRRARRKFAEGQSVIPQNTFQDWEKIWMSCIDSGGEYSEGDNAYYFVSLLINALKRIQVSFWTNHAYGYTVNTYRFILYRITNFLHVRSLVLTEEIVTLDV